MDGLTENAAWCAEHDRAQQEAFRASSLESDVLHLKDKLAKADAELDRLRKIEAAAKAWRASLVEMAYDRAQLSREGQSLWDSLAPPFVPPANPALRLYRLARDPSGVFRGCADEHGNIQEWGQTDWHSPADVIEIDEAGQPVGGQQ